MAPDAIECAHAAHCPGCPLIGLSPGEQLTVKTDRVRRALAGFPALAEVAVEAARAAPTLTDYRARAKLVVAAGARVGLYARGASHEVLDLPGCRVLAPPLAEAAAALRRLLAAPPPGAGAVLRAEGDGGGVLRAVDLREVRDDGGAGVLVTLVLRAPPEPREDALAAVAEALVGELPALRGMALSLHDGRSPQLLGAAPRPVSGPAEHRDRVRAGAPFARISYGAFAQAHRGQLAALHEAVLAALAPLARRRVLDLYAGSGALGLALAAEGARVTLVEAFAPALDAAGRAAAEQGLAARVALRPGAAEAWLPKLLAEGARFEAALVNPPRRGVAPRVREALAALCEGPLVYVSCAPETLARDLAHLAWLGLRAERVAPFDLMPLTEQVECLAILRRAPPPALSVLHDADGLVAIDKPPFLPTVPHPERVGSALERVRALPGAAAAAPLHRLDAGTSGVCLFARSAGDAARWQAALADAGAAKRYLALVRGRARAKGRIARALREDGRELPAATRYRRLAVAGGHALLEASLESGRTHQIRRHLAAIGEPVLGDERYGHVASNRHLFERHGLDRPFLHCASIELDGPGGRLRIAAPLAPDLAAVLASLGAAPGLAA